MTYKNNDYYAAHGFVVSSWLTLGSILDQISTWTLDPSHYDEILLLSVSITGGPFPTQTCQAFDQKLGSALLTPSEAQAHFGTTDPAQITFGQLWSMQGSQGPPRVIMSDPTCMDAADPSAGTWSDSATSQGGLYGGYYSDQCFADPYVATFGYNISPWPGIIKTDLQAVKTRATQGGGDSNGAPVAFGPVKAGGFYDLGVEGTPTLDCYYPLSSFDGAAQYKVLAALYQQWISDSATKANLNIVSGDH